MFLLIIFLLFSNQTFKTIKIIKKLKNFELFLYLI